MTTSTLVQPLDPPRPQKPQRLSRALVQVSRPQLLKFAYSTSLLALVVFLTFGQFLSSTWGTATSIQTLSFGQRPELGLYHIVGSSDEPFSDRSYVCVARGRIYKPVAARDALNQVSTRVVDSTGAAVNGYRVVSHEGLTIDPATNRSYYSTTCNFIAAKIEAIFEICTALGYNSTQGSNLRIVDGVHSATMKLIGNALPVIVIPYYDNSVDARFVIPGHDGSARLFHFSGHFSVDQAAKPILTATDRSSRERKTSELLRRPGGAWRNGWYEDPLGGKWHSDVMSSDPNSTLGIYLREFDMTTGNESDCTTPTSHCGRTSHHSAWGTKLQAVDVELASSVVVVSNGAHFGLFMYEGIIQHVIQSEYSLEHFISNISLAWLLLRWTISIAALANDYFGGGEKELPIVGMGVLSCSRGFNMLPLVLLPRLKSYLAVLATIGCEFEGSQRALSQASFVVYPAIAELTLFTYSVVNLLAKLARRRMSDALFGPTLMLLCGLHFFRNGLANARLFGIDGRVTSLVSSAEFDTVTLVDFVRTDILLRLSGGIRALLLLKLLVFALNLLLLVLWSRPVASTDLRSTDFELALALRLASSGGLGLRQ